MRAGNEFIFAFNSHLHSIFLCYGYFDKRYAITRNTAGDYGLLIILCNPRIMQSLRADEHDLM